MNYKAFTLFFDYQKYHKTFTYIYNVDIILTTKKSQIINLKTHWRDYDDLRDKVE